MEISKSKNIKFSFVKIKGEEIDGRILHTITLMQNGEALMIGGVQNSLANPKFCDSIYSFYLFEPHWKIIQKSEMSSNIP